jgi:ABC-2 type transport system ATP-binding protein
MIEVSHLKKHFVVRAKNAGFFSRATNTVRAVDDVSFGISRGEVVGYLGPNGAGKSTTIKMLTGLLVPSSGAVNIGGLVPWRQRKAHVARIGAVFGHRTTLWWDLPVIESLGLLKHIYRVSDTQFKHNLEMFTALLGLEEFLYSPVRSLSLGQRMRADLAAALLHDPELLFLDEPTIGLDVVAKDRIRAFIQHVNATRGVTVLLTTHDLADVSRLCQRVMIIDHGKLLYDGKLEALQTRFGGERQLVVDFLEPIAYPEVIGARVVDRDGARVTYAFSRDAVSAAELIARVTTLGAVRDLSVLEPDIEATIREIYERDLLRTLSPNPSPAVRERGAER